MNLMKKDLEDDYSNFFHFSGIVPPPGKIKNRAFRTELATVYARRWGGWSQPSVTWKKENGWTHEMIRVVMKTAREMEE